MFEEYYFCSKKFLVRLHQVFSPEVTVYAKYPVLMQMHNKFIFTYTISQIITFQMKQLFACIFPCQLPSVVSVSSMDAGNSTFTSACVLTESCVCWCSSKCDMNLNLMCTKTCLSGRGRCRLTERWFYFPIPFQVSS